jgi:hypothetical protein
VVNGVTTGGEYSFLFRPARLLLPARTTYFTGEVSAHRARPFRQFEQKQNSLTLQDIGYKALMKQREVDALSSYSVQRLIEQGTPVLRAIAGPLPPGRRRSSSACARPLNMAGADHLA